MNANWRWCNLYYIKLSHWTYKISSTGVLYDGEAKLVWSSFDLICISQLNANVHTINKSLNCVQQLWYKIWITIVFTCYIPTHCVQAYEFGKQLLKMFVNLNIMRKVTDQKRISFKIWSVSGIGLHFPEIDPICIWKCVLIVCHDQDRLIFTGRFSVALILCIC